MSSLSVFLTPPLDISLYSALYLSPPTISLSVSLSHYIYISHRLCLDSPFWLSLPLPLFPIRLYTSPLLLPQLCLNTPTAKEARAGVGEEINVSGRGRAAGLGDEWGKEARWEGGMGEEGGGRGR